MVEELAPTDSFSILRQTTPCIHVVEHADFLRLDLRPVLLRKEKGSMFQALSNETTVLNMIGQGPAVKLSIIGC